MNNSDLHAIFFIIPTKNRWNNVRKLLGEIQQQLYGCPYKLFMIIVNDTFYKNSENTIKDIPDIFEYNIIQLKKNYGQRLATMIGVKQAADYAFAKNVLTEKTIFITMDDDGGHPAQALENMIAAFKNNKTKTLAYASPIYTNTIRSFGSSINHIFFRISFRLQPDVKIGSFRAFPAKLAYEALNLPVSYPYLSAMLLSCHPETKMVYFNKHTKMETGAKSTYSLLKLANIWLKLFIFWGPFKALGKIIRIPSVFDDQRYIYRKSTGNIDE